LARQMVTMSLLGLIALGLCLGGVTGLIGSSGVLIVVPALTLFFGLPIHTAIGTSLAVDVIASIIVSIVYLKMGNGELRSGLGLALGAVVGAQVGSRIAKYIPSANLGRGFGIFLVIIGAGRLSGKGLIGLLSSQHSPQSMDTKKVSGQNNSIKVGPKQVAVSLVLGFLLGIISGIFGAGGGIMFLLTLIVLLKYPLHKAVGTSTLMMTLTALSGAIGYALNGYMSPLAFILVGAGAIVGGKIGAIYANKVPEASLSKIIGIVFIALGIIMIAEQLL
jgi:uncharacterized membrane protein YfcA